MPSRDRRGDTIDNLHGSCNERSMNFYRSLSSLFVLSPRRWPAEFIVSGGCNAIASGGCFRTGKWIETVRGCRRCATGERDR